MKQTITLYSHTGWKRLFGHLRFWYAPFQEVEDLLPKNGTIIDLGCAEGFLVNYIALSSAKRNVLGIELDAKRLAIANQGVKNAHFKAGDITKVDLPRAHAIIIFHVLHHLPSLKDQEQVIEHCYKSLVEGGKLIIVEIHKKPTPNYLLTWLTDNFLVAWVFEHRLKTPILFRKKDEWIELLNKHNFTVSTHFGPLYKPFSNVLFECTKL